VMVCFTSMTTVSPAFGCLEGSWSIASLSVWELDCHASVTTAQQFKLHPRLSADTCHVPLLILRSGTQRAQCQIGASTLDRFLIREAHWVPTLLHLGNDLLRVVRMRPLVSVAVSGDRYSVACECAAQFLRFRRRCREKVLPILIATETPTA
jgi:hypothetical protein